MIKTILSWVGGLIWNSLPEPQKVQYDLRHFPLNAVVCEAGRLGVSETTIPDCLVATNDNTATKASKFLACGKFVVLLYPYDEQHNYIIVFIIRDDSEGMESYLIGKFLLARPDIDEQGDALYYCSDILPWHYGAWDKSLLDSLEELRDKVIVARDNEEKSQIETAQQQKALMAERKAKFESLFTTTNANRT